MPGAEPTNGTNFSNERGGMHGGLKHREHEQAGCCVRIAVLSIRNVLHLQEKLWFLVRRFDNKFTIEEDRGVLGGVIF